jgi:hypothetical protein
MQGIEQNLDYWSHVLTQLALVSQLDPEEADASIIYSMDPDTSWSASSSDYESLSMFDLELGEADAEEGTRGEMLSFKNLEPLSVQQNPGTERIHEWIKGVDGVSSSGDSDDCTAQMML